MRLVEGVVDVDDVDSFVAAIDEISRETGATIQAFDARYLVSDRHLERAVELADRAIDRDEAIARDRAVEILLYAAARRQISDALELGVDEGPNRTVVLVDGGDERQAAAAVRSRLLTAVEPTLGEYDPERVRTFFDVGDDELAVVDGDLEAVVLERVALLVVEK
ncbi:KEOPS complex subunit Cgi121 [Halobellus clavatus]|jgi:KEOPS complex subunit Cgi121|uniref:KEOPS complex subunit Cgi121 n=1 Tax=Halobellus clavatus TaxID=660517 RepID=A0A1H3E6Z6_9EURY|nr:KEOPS complex subunit Cgi121 [Halobellus clavatus]SDX74028.1 KEOPS complex subunit Cgi121 [Halobellus clavatus]